MQDRLFLEAHGKWDFRILIYGAIRKIISGDLKLRSVYF